MPKTLELDLGDKVTMKFVQIPVGKFLMGSPKDEKGRSDIEAQHEVIISRPFFMAVYPVTQEQYKAVMGTNPSKIKGDTQPVECVSWDDAHVFCKKASAKTGRQFRLPTEAEWEYACRAGTTSAYFFGDDAKDLGDYAWYTNSKGTTHPAGQKKPNPWGLYDIIGNVGQWCEDAFTPPPPPKGQKGGPGLAVRIDRGGFWDYTPEACRFGGSIVVRSWRSQFLHRLPRGGGRQVTLLKRVIT